MPKHTLSANRKRQITAAGACVLLFGWLLLKTFLKLYIGFFLSSLIAFLLFGLLLLLLLFGLQTAKQQQLVYSGLLIIFITLWVFCGDISDRIFLGKTVTETSLSETPGAADLILYQRGRFKIEHGGKLGVTDELYGKYTVAENVIMLFSTHSVAETNDRIISIGAATYVIKVPAE